MNDTVFAWIHATDSFLCVAVSKYIFKIQYKYVQLTLSDVKKVFRTTGYEKVLLKKVKGSDKQPGPVQDSIPCSPLCFLI